VAVDLAGRLDAAALLAAVGEIERRHEALRTTFEERGGEPVQRIHSEPIDARAVVDLAGLPGEAAEEEAGRIRAGEAVRPFDLEHAPLLRTLLVRRAERDHLFLLTFHHIVSDGWSTGVFVRELTGIYPAFMKGEPAGLPELPIQYADFAEWQRGWLSGEALEAQLGYWRERLAGLPPALDLPLDRPRPVPAAHRGGRRAFQFDPVLTAALRELGRREEATLFMVLLAGWAALLGRISGQTDLAVGSPIAGRNRQEIEGLIGFFVNTLTLRSDLTGDPPFRELLGRVRAATQGAYAHQDLPFERLVEELQPARELGRNPLFQVAFALQNAPAPEVEVEGLTLKTLAAETGTAKFDLALDIWEAGDRLGGELEYSAELFDPTTIDRLGGYFWTLLTAAVAEPGRRLSELPLLGEPERHQLLREWNDTAAGLDRGVSVCALFEEQARARPEDPAAVFEGGPALTYRELAERSGRLAGRLRGRGVEPEEVVAFWAERSPGMLAALVGIARAGAACLPLDPSHPDERLALQLREAGVRLAVAADPAGVDRLERIAGGAVRVLREDESGQAIFRLFSKWVSQIDPDQVLSVLYTSGSTGRPKGVAVPHRGVVRLVRGGGPARIATGETVLQLAPIAFDASTFEIWGTLANGARLVFPAPGPSTLDGIARLVAEQRVDVLHLTAGLFHAMVEDRLEALRGLQRLLTGGDALSAGHVRRAVRELPGCEVVCCYGPTEGTTFTSCWAAGGGALSQAGEGRGGGSFAPLGRPIADTQVHLLDADLRPVPIGVPGELCVGGEGLARGYLGQPDRTAERFVPFPSARLYRTGDRARYRTDGTLEFLGRFDGQVKIRGFRVEPGEVEAALESHPAVARAVVLALGRGEGARLAAFAIPRDGDMPPPAGLRAYLQERLPEPMLPGTIEILDEFPLTPNAKVDRRALASRAAAAPSESGADDRPLGPDEERIAAVWAEVLGRERVGLRDDFFALGGHSLLAIRLLSRLRDAFGVEIPLRALFESPTVEGVAARLAVEVGSTLPPVTPVPREGALPQSYAQQRLWFIDQLEPGTSLYSVPFDIRLEGELDAPALEAAFGALIARHEILRTTYGPPEGDDGVPVQTVHPPVPCRLPVADLSALPEPDRESARLTEEEFALPFDLTAGPVFRVRLVKMREGDHRLLTTTHHIACDAGSLAVVWGEVAALYAAATEGRLAPFPPLPVQYADYAVWQRRWLAGEGFESQLRYWKERLGDEPPALELPADHPRPAVQSHLGGTWPVEILPETDGPLRALARREGVTPFLTGLALFQALLRRDSGQTDVSVGTPVSGRGRAELEGVVGFFLNTLVLRVDLPGDPTFRDLLRRVRDLALEAFAHGDLPFDRLVDELRPQRSLSRSPLFQALFVLLHSGGGAAVSPLAELPPGLDVSFFLPAQTTAKFDLTLSLFSGDEPGMEGAFEYAADLFDATTVARLADRLAILAGGLATDPDRPLSAQPVLAEAERHQLLAEHNDTAADIGEDGGVHHLFERQVERTPDAPAAVFAGESLSYAELNGRADRLAAGLRARGVGPDVRVAISLERGLDVAVAVLGVLKAGGAYVPIDPAYPEERRNLLLADSRPALVLTAADLPGLQGGGAPLSLEAGEGWGGGDSLAYVLYTSGSTGRPKGVALPHRAVRNLIEWHRSAIGGGRRTLQYASLSFDVSFHEMFAAWATGGAVVMVREELRADIPALADFLVAQGIGKAVMPVVVLQELAEEYARRDRLSPLAELTTTGEALQTTSALAALLRRLPGCLFQNHYGPTESHVVTCHTLDPEPARWDSHPPIGRPIANARLRVLDAGLRPVPLGVVGELSIGGVPLARGYLDQPGLTAERFVPDPLGVAAGEPGARLYRTGDRARYRADGEIDFLGRFDHQVKVRGFRVEPEEIEAVLGGHPAVRQAVVLAREDRPGDRRLVAYAVPREPAAVTPAALRAYLRERLPDYMVPSHLILLAELPLTPNRKVDRRALPAPEKGAEREPAASPRTPVEEVLAAIWSEVLGGNDRIGLHDDFFALGGHSLLATRVVSRVRDAFRVELPLRALFEEPTVAGLARRVEAARGAARVPELPPITPAGGEGRRELPLAFAQQRLWFLDRLVPDNPFYNMPLAVGLAGRLDVAALRAAFAALVRRHETLRTSFPEQGGRPVQAVADAGEAGVPRVDLEGLPGERRDLEARRLTVEEASRPFDLRQGPLVRARLVRLAAEEHALLVTLHHIISDGWSLGVLHAELAALYGAFADRQPSPLPDLPIQYGDFAVWQRERLQGEALEALLGYWRRRLAGLPESLTLPYDRPRPAVESFRGRNVSFTLPAERVRPLAGLTRRLGATPSMTFLAGFQALLGRLADTADVPVGVAIANRTRREVEGLIGFFVNTLVLRGDLGAPGGFADLVIRTREAALDAFAHQDLPFERLVEEIRPERDLGRNPLIQVMFGYQNFPRSEARVRGLILVPPPEERADSGTSKFDLTLFLYEQGEALAAVLEYSSDLFDETTVRRFAAGFEALLRGAVEAPDRPLGLLPLLSEAERHQLAREWNATAAAYPEEAGIPELFARQVRRGPEALAVIYGERGLTYGELDRQAEELAERLATAGVGLESRVGLCMERSPELIVGMLGILKAGGTYVPLDPEYPQERLAFLIEDAGLAALVATETAAALLPEHGLPTLFVAGGVGAPSPAKRGRVGEGASLAYVIYTSGSTGRPKGVEVPHRAISRLVLGTDYLQLGPADRVAQAATASFDAATFEIWGPLLNGGCVVGIPKETALDPAALEEALRRFEVTALFVTTALFHQVARDRPAAFSTLDALLFGGEAIDPRRVREVLAAGPPRRLLHVYGPTESTTFATAFRVEEVGEAAVPIGRPIANTRLHVLDALHQPVPLGSPGELCLGGDGLARGYARQPGLTAAKWIPDPLGGPGESLYRTGDRVRLRPDGNVEFLGRLDTQVKVRGFRIEPGEIEARLTEHPGVREAVVLPVEVEGDRRLVAYLVREPGWSPLADEARPEQVAQWQGVFDDIYARAHRPDAPEPDPAFNVVGWIDTYTDTPLPREEMAEWLEDTVGRILALRPRRVLEIGCGTGLILFRVARYAERYVGLDISARVLGEVEAHLQTWDPRPPVELLQRRADQLDEFAPVSFDTVILNSVVQYFPGPAYLAGVVAAAVRLLRPGGAIFLGDLRSLPLADVYRASLDLYGAESELPARILRPGLEHRRRAENEMLVDPRFFAALRAQVPEVKRVEIHPKRGRARNELTAFRYQVVLRIGEGAGPPRPEVEWLDWQAEGMTIERLRLVLSCEAGEGRGGGVALGLRNIPNARTALWWAESRLLRGPEGDAATVGELRRRARAETEASAPVEPQDLWDVVRDLPWEVELGWSTQEPDGRFEAVLRPQGAGGEPLGALLSEPVAAPGEPLSRYANDPLERRTARQLAAELRAWLAARLPEPMVPSAFLTLAELPLTPNGKVDRRALALRGAAETGVRAGRGGGRLYVPPRTPLEGSLAAVWAALLGVEAVGAHDDFFELGGHSLLATQVVSRVRQELGGELPLRDLFEHPTVSRLAARIEERSREERDTAPPLRPALRPADGRLPLSFAQERLWFLHRLDPASPAYNEQAAFRLTGRLDVAALRWSLDEIVRRHESLRTVFDEDEGQPFQTVLPAAPLGLPGVDLSRLPGPAAGAEARRLAAEQTFRPFDLARGPLARALLFRLGGEDHALVFAFHHIVFDGWSAGVLARELEALYAARIAGRASPLPPLEIQVPDFAVWQRGWLQGEALARQLDYWRQRLAGIEPLELPADRPRPAVFRARGGSQPLVLPESVARAVRDLARREGATPFMVLLAVFQALLRRHADPGEERPDAPVGSMIANRNRAETEGLIGFFVNVLVLRADLSGDPGFRELLRRVREVALGAYAHQDLPFERLVGELQPERDLARNPLFEAGFQVVNVPGAGPALPGLEVGPFPLGERGAKLDINLSLSESREGIAGLLDYDADRFDRTTAARLLGHFERLLRAALAAPDRRLSELPLLTPEEEHQALAEWNDTRPTGEPAPFLERFEAHAARDPGAPALLGEGGAVSYGELDRRAEDLAGWLRGRGAGAEKVVGIALEASAEAVVAILAVWKVGAAYVPLDPSYPEERLAFYRADSGAEIVVGEAGAGAPLSRSGGSAAGRGDGGEGDLAYLLYTSGSTGEPKGVEITHRGFAHLIDSQIRTLRLGPGQRLLQFAALAFDASAAEIGAALGSGAALVLRGPESRLPGEGMARLLAEQRVTAAVLTPSALAALPAADLPAFDTLAVAGEVCSPDLPARWVAPGRRFLNLYGPTEATVQATGGEIRPGEAPTLGRPIPAARAYVVDARLRSLPAGVPGELALAGSGLARGYRGRPALTAARFVPDPWGKPGGRLYRTGDRVRLLADGRLDFLGRLDQQVKVRGIRVELGEIESRLLGDPRVRQAAVLLVEDRAVGPRLAAFVVAPEGGIDEDGLRRLLRRGLPEALIPSSFVFLQELPRTPGGKLDRRALPRLAPALGEGRRGYIPPRTPVEEVLAGIWSELLGVGQVGAGDDFFALSGHSLLATQVAHRIRQVFGMDLPLRRLFERTTLAELALEIERAGGRPGAAAEETIPRVPRDEPLPASFYQELAWQLQGGPLSAEYNMPHTVVLPAGVDRTALRRALAGLARRQEALRTTFREEAGELLLHIAPPAEVPLPVVDLAGLPETLRRAAAEALAREDAARPFHLIEGPLFRVLLLELGAEGKEAGEAWLLLNLHHILSDGWSMGVMRRDLTLLYAAFAAGRPSPLAEPPIQFADYAAWQRRTFAGEPLDTQLAWWRRHLADPPPHPELPYDRPRQGEPGPAAVVGEVTVPPPLTRALRALASRSGASLAMVLLAAFETLTYRHTGACDLLTAATVSGRNRPELAGVIGLFMNTLILRTDLSGSPTFLDLLLRVRDTVLDAYRHQDVPYPQLLAGLFPGRELSRTLLSRRMFNLIAFPEMPDPAGTAAGFDPAVVPNMEEQAKQDLALDCLDLGATLHCRMIGAADLFTAETAAALAADYGDLLAAIADHPETPLDHFPGAPRRPLRHPSL
jgi:amino acid adenylation domain-containing protein